MKIRVFEAFAGYGSQAMALHRLKEKHPTFDYEVVGIAEIDKYAIQAYNAVHGTTSNYGDISKIDWSEVPDFDLFTYSFPCFVAGTLIHTDKGYKCIEDITADDYVLTHTNTYKKVVKPMKHLYNGDLYHIKTMLGHELICTPEHPFYVRRKYRKGHLGIRTFKEPEWVLAKNLDKGNENKADLSLLAKYAVKEEEARRMCEKAGLLSPVYAISTRQGCWFCPNTRLCSIKRFRIKHPELWAELEKLDKVNKILDGMDMQLELFPELT